MFAGKLTTVVGAEPSTSTSIESLDVSGAGFVTPFVAVIALEPGAAGEEKEYVGESYGLVVSVDALVPKRAGNVTPAMPESGSLAFAWSVKLPVLPAASQSVLCAAS